MEPLTSIHPRMIKSRKMRRKAGMQAGKQAGRQAGNQASYLLGHPALVGPSAEVIPSGQQPYLLTKQFMLF